MNDLTKGIFEADLKTNVTVYRQYLQTEYVKVLIMIMDPKTSVYDDVARAAALNSIKKLKNRLAAAVSTNEETRAHRANLLFMINKGLESR
jgi:hypothetical protein